jgi:aspartyl/asparaginyl-tRNA synthetase
MRLGPHGADMKNFGFVELNDGSCQKSLQVVLERGRVNNYDEIVRRTSAPRSLSLARWP